MQRFPGSSAQNSGYLILTINLQLLRKVVNSFEKMKLNNSYLLIQNRVSLLK